LQFHGSLGFIKQATVSSNETEGTDVLPGAVKSWLPQSCLPKHKTKSHVLMLIFAADKLAHVQRGESPVRDKRRYFHMWSETIKAKEEYPQNQFCIIELASFDRLLAHR